MTYGNNVISVDRHSIVPDGDPCDRCPRSLGKGGRRVLFNGREERMCHKCYTQLSMQVAIERAKQ